jgi:hypothetical protein
VPDAQWNSRVEGYSIGLNHDRNCVPNYQGKQKSTFAIPTNHELCMVESYTLEADGREIKKNMMTPWLEIK